MRPPIVSVLPWPAVVVLVTAMLAGCTEDSAFVAQASSPVVMAQPSTPGFGYDGTGMQEASGTLRIDVRDGSNTGQVEVDLEVPAGPAKGSYHVRWSDFHIQPGATWQDGGIACGIVEHGASGHGNRMEPQMDLHCGGWGTANGTRDGQPLTDPITGATQLNAHFMVSKQAMLQDGNRVLKADRMTPFDPATPGDGYVEPGRIEGHFAIWGAGAFADGIAQGPAPLDVVQLAGTAAGLPPPGPAYTDSTPLDVPANAVVQLDLAMETPTGQLWLRLVDDRGATVGEVAVDPTAPAATTTLGPLVGGLHSLQVTGHGGTEFTASASVQAPAPLLLHVVFREVDLG